MSKINPNTLARDYAVQFLYQCEADQLFYFSDERLQDFLSYFVVEGSVRDYLKTIVSGVLSNLQRIDQIVSSHSKNWKLNRMASTDRVVLRIATFEVIEKLAPEKVILNEAIELAKRYGTEHSGSFVNGILDAIVSEAKK